MTVIKSPSTDPVSNFALERELLTGRTEDFLLLYINSPCVVVGRNQQPEAEADLDWCAREGIPVLRRITGGGAVWHDTGNINWAFITTADRAPLDEKPLAGVIAALRKMGIEAMAGGRGELYMAGAEDSGGKKISGTASCVTGGRRLFHGTLLFDADLGRMNRALAGEGGKRGRRVASVPSCTANLKPFLSNFDTAADFMEKFASELVRYYS